MKKEIEQKFKIIVIVGTTSSGKSDFAVEIAKKYNGEIISADSRQVYRDLDIGTGKITKKEMQGVAHHMLDVASPRLAFTVAQFKKKGEKILKDITNREKLPIIAGGTGFYIDALLKGNSEFPFPEVPPNHKLRTQLEKKSTTELFTQLKHLDPRRACGIDQHNPRRLIRAIEIALTLGSVPTLSKIPHLVAKGPDLDSGSPSGYKYNVLWIGLKIDKEILIEKIAKRHNKMLKLGLIAEVKKLRIQKISWKRIYELGFEYKFIAQFLRGEIALDEALEKMNTETWRYAKRQTNWFKRNKEINWFNPKDIKNIATIIENF